MITKRPVDVPARRPAAEAADLNGFMTTCATSVVMAALHSVDFATARSGVPNAFDVELFDVTFRVTVDYPAPGQEATP